MPALHLTLAAHSNTCFSASTCAVPAVKRISYSTCSVHQSENEDVVDAILRGSKGSYRLVRALPQWEGRGLDVIEGGMFLCRGTRVSEADRKRGTCMVAKVGMLFSLHGHVSIRGLSVCGLTRIFLPACERTSLLRGCPIRTSVPTRIPTSV